MQVSGRAEEGMGGVGVPCHPHDHGLSNTSKPFELSHGSKKRKVILWYLGPFQQSLPQSLLQLSQCYSAKLSVLSKVNGEHSSKGVILARLQRMQCTLRALGLAAGVETKELSQSVCGLSLLRVGTEQGVWLLLIGDLLWRG